MRLIVATALACALIPVSARADNLLGESSSTLPGVTIEVPASPDRSPDGWDTPPLIAQLIPNGNGVVLYRFGAGPGTWQRCIGPVVIPPGKQTLSAVLIAPNGTPGPISTITARSDIHAMPLSGTAALAVEAANDSDVATYTGEPAAAGAVTVSVLVGRQLGTIVRRLGGRDRYGTGAVLSASAPKHGKWVIIATGDGYADALTASGLAGCLNAPVLLTGKKVLPPQTKSELVRLGTKKALIIGSTSVISAKVGKKIKALGIAVDRLGGKTRYETAVAVARRIEKITHHRNQVFIARGDRFCDALVIAPLAYRTHSPILLTTPGKLTAATASRLKSARYASAIVVGNIGPRAEKGVRNRVSRVDRWAGANQFDTSVQVATNSVLSGSLSWQYVGIARGDVYADAMCGGVLAGSQGGVILLTPPKSLYPGVADALTAHTADVRRCEVYGGQTAISANVLAQIKAIFH